MAKVLLLNQNFITLVKQHKKDFTVIPEHLQVPMYTPIHTYYI